MRGEFLSNIVATDDIKTGALNLIHAPCGSGKTEFAKTKLSQFSRENFLLPPLYLIDTVNGKEQLLKGGEEKYGDWSDEPYWEIPGILRVMTYAGYYTMAANNPKLDCGDATLVICDEFHNAIKWSKWKDNDLHEKALGLISYHIAIDKGTYVALSATPNRIREEFDWCLNELPLYGEPRHYEEGEITEYRNLTAILNHIQVGQRGIVYIPHISTIQKYEQLMQERGFKTSAIWSIKNEQYPMSKEQLENRKAILEQRRMPVGIDILFINSSCETSITIGNEKDTCNLIDLMVIHSADPDVQIQVRGRYRNDLPHLYIHDSNAVDEIVIPEKWLDKNLRKSDIEEIIRELNIRDKKRELIKAPTFCELALDNGYAYERKTIKGIRYKTFSQ